MLVISVNTRQLPTLSNWQAACHRLGYTPVVLGQGKEWGGWIWRCRQVLEYLEQGGLPAGEYVVVQDSDDVLPLRPATHLLGDVAGHYQTELVFGHERYNLGKNIGWVGSIRDHLNMGCIMGTVAGLCRLYRWIIIQHGLDPSRADDQILASTYFWGNPGACSLDREHRLVMNFNPVSSLLGQDGKGWFPWLRDPRLQVPYFVHFPGSDVFSLSRLQFDVLYSAVARETIGDAYVPVGLRAPRLWRFLGGGME